MTEPLCIGPLEPGPCSTDLKGRQLAAVASQAEHGGRRGGASRPLLPTSPCRDTQLGRLEWQT